jgi:hypothetical protein
VYFGHYAVAAAIRAKKPTLPLVPTMVGVGLIEIVDGIFIVAGVDRVTPHSAAVPYPC